MRNPVPLALSDEPELAVDADTDACPVPAAEGVEPTRTMFVSPDIPADEATGRTPMFMQSQEPPLQLPATSPPVSKSKQRRGPMVPISAFAPEFVAELDAYSHLVTKPTKRTFSEKTDGRLQVRKMKKPTVVTRLAMLRRGAVLYAKIMDIPWKEVTSMSVLIVPALRTTFVPAPRASARAGTISPKLSRPGPPPLRFPCRDDGSDPITSNEAAREG